MPEPRFKSVQKFKTDYSETKFAQYESSRTGLRVVFVHQPTPKISCGIAVATEIHDDSGAPHTLEHLVFTASRSYDKGFLDRLATRSYGYTNAYTEDDKTVYELSAAGEEGFANVLPVYLDHLLFPKLRDAACYTEVYHIDGEGKDNGVVYSEMQARENDAYDLIDFNQKQQIYPKNVGYRYHTGGLTQALRVLTNDRIRDFHHAMYQPKNICVVIVGDVNETSLLQKLDQYEDTIVGHVPQLDDAFQRPWAKDGRTPELTKSTRESVEFPESDEQHGQIQISYLGPGYKDDVDSVAMSVFLDYLSGGPVALLDRTIVEEEHLASYLSYSSTVRHQSVIAFDLSDVETGKLDQVADRFFEVLESAADGPLDMAYLKDRLMRDKRSTMWQREESGTLWVSEVADDHIFGNRDGSDLRQFRSMATYDTVNEWTEDQWRSFLRKWFVDAKSATTLARPSKALSTKLEKEDGERVKQRQSELGEKGLQDLAKKLEEAKAENDKPVPKELLQRYPIPAAESIRFIETETALAGLARKSNLSASQGPIQKIIEEDDKDLPLFIDFEHVKSNFVTVGMLFNTHCIPKELMPALTLFCDIFLELPINRDGKRVEFEEVVADVERDTVTYSDRLYSFVSSEVLAVTMSVEPEKYQAAIKWTKTFLTDSIFDKERLQSSLMKLISGMSQLKRSGSDVASAMASFTHTTRQTTSRRNNLLIKSPHLKKMLVDLREQPKALISKLEEIRKAILQSSSFRCFVIANLENGKIQQPVSSWTTLTDVLPNKANEVVPIDRVRDTLSAKALNPGNLTYVMPMRSIDSSYAFTFAKGVTSYDDPRFPAMWVAKAYLEVIEGPLWNAVRGAGLAYGSGFSNSVEEGLFGYNIWRSTNIYKAFEVSRHVVSDLADGKVPIDDLWLEDAIVSVVAGTAEEGATMLSAASQSVSNQVIKGIPKDWSKQFAKKVQQVTKDDVVTAIKEFLVPVFRHETANIFMTCAPVMEAQAMEDFRKAGYEPETKGWNDFKDNYGLDLGGLDEEEGDPEDEDDESEEDDEDEEAEEDQDVE